MKRVESKVKQKIELIKQLQHKRFSITMNDKSTSFTNHWYVQPTRSSVPVGNEINGDDKFLRPDCIHT
jgi:hypothetical protein